MQQRDDNSYLVKVQIVHYVEVYFVIVSLNYISDSSQIMWNQATWHDQFTVFLRLFQAWVSDSVTNDFQDAFVIDVEPNEKEGYA